jgi:O-acetyl-ADP-ribose deacetylase (regulator of RNase III)/protein-tyrosine phosphatase/rhodanese-related sulfurtransferase
MSNKKFQINIDTSQSNNSQEKAVSLSNSDNLVTQTNPNIVTTPSTPLSALGDDYRDPKDFKLLLVDPNFDLCKQFKLKFGRYIRKNQNAQQQLPAQWGQAYPNVVIKCLRFEDIYSFDCMVSAANSFGLMDGGVDDAITQFFGDQLEMRVQQHILRFFDGEQPVGTSFIIPTFHANHPYLAHTPTLRVLHSIQQTDNVYLAMKAMLRAVADHNERALMNPQEFKFIETVVCPGLGTNHGNMDLAEAARQMALAYENFYNVPRAIDWGFANERQRKIIWGGNIENGLHILNKLKESKRVEVDSEPSTPLVAPSFPEELQEDPKVTHISRMDFYNLAILNHYLLVDTRSASDFAKCSIPNSVNVPPENGSTREAFESIKFPQVELNHIILLCHGDVEQDLTQKSHVTAILDYYATKKGVKAIYVLSDRFEVFEKTYPFLCQDSNDVYPSQLLPHLFLGSAIIASSPDVAKKVGLTHILSTETRMAQRRGSTGFVPIENVTYLQLNVDENEEKSIRKFYEDAIKFIDEAKEKNGRVLVFCNRGESKGPCVAIVYLMKTLLWTWEEAASYVKRARPVFEPFPAFADVAKQIEIDLFNVEQD